ncbi:winged helix-turn-helix domain-containing protein [Halosimplex amylolyticum]|uniref:winged helix-turn-helix domain-containing protein n=1 Tax=Halosimplex amylolyticum TaxID=3396616 RepID=UPI003F54F6F6
MSPPGEESSGRGDDSAESGASDDSHVDPSEAFAALSDPLRVDILRALAAFHRESGPGPIGFADLRKRVDVRDSGRFRYHLNELRDHFVRKADGGYRLTHAGIEIVAAILAGTYTERGSMGPEPLDSVCSLCDASAVAVYEDGYCAVSCENDHPLFHWSVPPAAAADASLPEVVSRAELFARQAIERTLAGVCPKCSAPVDPAIVEDDAAPTPRLRARCDTCGATMAGPVGFCLLVDPAVESFYRRHDRPLDDLYVWEPAFVADDSTVSVAATDPLRVEISVTLDDETLAVSVDEAGRVSVDQSDHPSTDQSDRPSTDEPSRGSE